MRKVFIISAKRTAVVPRGGAFKDKEAYDLAAPVLEALISEADISAKEIGQIILGNALYGGGNPARMAGLAAGFPHSIPALTIDTQCCSGLDAISIAVQKIGAGESEVILAGGLESYSRSPIRMRRPKNRDDEAIAYDRPAFSPKPEEDPDPVEAAAVSAQAHDISRQEQEQVAIDSHQKSWMKTRSQNEIVDVNGVFKDTFTRDLDQKFCSRLKPLAGSPGYEVTSATVAVEADAAAAVLLVSEDWLRQQEGSMGGIEVIDTISIGSDPRKPLDGATIATEQLLKKHKLQGREIAVSDVMEAFAVQIPPFLSRIKIDPTNLNRGGGALSRGHPIGASGAINAVRLWYEMLREDSDAYGIAAIAAVGGLGSALLLQKTDLA